MRKSSIAYKIALISITIGALFSVIVIMFVYMQSKLYNQILSQEIQIELAETQSLITEFHFKRNAKIKNEIVDMKNQLWNSFEEVGEEPSISFIKDNTEELFILFDKSYSIVEKLGLDENSGAQGQFREAIHIVQEELKALNRQDIEILLLEMRRREKDYMLRRKSKYIQDVFNLANKIILNIDIIPNISPTNKSQLQQYVLNYKETFENYIQLYSETVAVKAKLDKQFEYLKVLGQNFAIKQNNHTNSAKGSLIITILFTVLVGVGLTIWQSRRIIQPIKTLRDGADKLANGDTKVKISKSDTKDEIWELAQSFEKLANKKNGQNQGKTQKFLSTSQS